MENAEEIHKAMDTAIAAVQVLTKDEEISDVEVEEIEQEPGTHERDRGDWLVTVGYNRQKTAYCSRWFYCSTTHLEGGAGRSLYR